MRSALLLGCSLALAACSDDAPVTETTAAGQGGVSGASGQTGAAGATAGKSGSSGQGGTAGPGGSSGGPAGQGGSEAAGQGGATPGGQGGAPAGGQAGSGGAGPSGSSGQSGGAGTPAGAGQGGGAGAPGGSGGAPAACGSAGPGPGDHDLTVMTSSGMRSFRLHVPPGYDGTKPQMLVVVFHGYTQTAGAIEKISQMTPAADQQGFLVAYPQGIGTSWNAGTCCGQAATEQLDDVGFTTALLDRIEQTFCVDPKRVYAAGLSNGGMFSNRLACQLSDRIAAIGPIAGPLLFAPCTPARPVPVLSFHGTSDYVVLYNGGGIQNAPPEKMAQKAWAERNGCAGEPSVYLSSGDATCERYEGCQQNATVALCTIGGGGHQWPGGKSAGDVFGKVSDDISATAQLIEFFQAHPLP